MVLDNVNALHPFQVEGVNFLTSRYHSLLADDMGLGKTVQVVAAFNKLKAVSMVVICPAQVKIHWARTILAWAPKVQPHQICIIRTGKTIIHPGASVIIVNYELAIRAKIHNQLVAKGAKRPFDVCVMDEAHYLKNPKAQRTKRVLGASSFLHHCRFKWALTGTPVLNRPAEFYPLLRTMAPETIEPYTSWLSFGQQFCNARRTAQGWDFSGYSHLDDLAARIKPYMLRRKKEDVLSQLPDTVSTVIPLDVQPPTHLDDTHIATVRKDLALAKLPEAIRYIGNMLAETPKVVVFAHHREVIEGLARGIKEFSPVICYGGMSSDQKQKSVDGFVNNPSVGVFIAQTVAGGTGIDGLQEVCNNVVFIELDWSPGIMDQAVDRLRRIGQKDTVFVHYLAVPDSLDTQMADVNKQKRKIINRVVLASEVKQTMSIEQSLERIADALEKLTTVSAFTTSAVAAATAPDPTPEVKPETPKPETPKAAPKPAAKKAEKPLPPAPKVPEIDEVAFRNAVGLFINKDGNKEINKRILMEVIWPKHGVVNLSQLCECVDGNYTHGDKWGAVLQDLEKGPQAYEDPGVEPIVDMDGV